MRKSSRKSPKVSSGERRYADCRNGLGIEAICWRLVRKKRKRKVHSLIDKVRNWKKIKNFSEGVDFLGFTIYIGHKVPRKEAVKKSKDAVRCVTRRNLPINLEMVIVKLNPIIVSWGNYFKIANVNRL